MAVFRVGLSLGWFWEDNIYYITLHSLRAFSFTFWFFLARYINNTWSS